MAGTVLFGKQHSLGTVLLGKAGKADKEGGVLSM